MTSNYSEYLRVRVTPEQKQKIEADAAAAGQKTSDYARSLLFPHDHSYSFRSNAVILPDESPVMQRLAAVETAVKSTPGGSKALDAAQQAIGLINRKEDNDNPK